jgi:hypothetical protein
MTVAERIARAGNSKNLTFDSREGSPTSDADVLIACGLSPSELGRQLSHLQSEWDGTAKPLKLTKSDAILLVNSLKSLSKVVAAITMWADKRGYGEPGCLARSSVSYWIDNTCHECYGRGYERINGTPTLGRPCQACRGNGKRAVPMGEPGRKAQNLMDDCLSRSQSEVAYRLRSN